LAGFEPDLGGHDGQQDVRARSEISDPGALPLQIGDRMYALSRKYLDTADLHPRENRDRLARVDGADEYRAIAHGEIDLAPRDRLR
jgi:hypothetical protein